MKYARLALTGAVMLSSLGLSTSLLSAQPADRLTVPVAFGRGLDTAQPGNAVNHVILPDKIKVKQGGVVHFLVSGFHQIFVYETGVESEDIDVPDMDTFHFPFPLCDHFLHVGFFKWDENFSENWRLDERMPI